MVETNYPSPLLLCRNLYANGAQRRGTSGNVSTGHVIHHNPRFDISSLAVLQQVRRIGLLQWFDSIFRGESSRDVLRGHSPYRFFSAVPLRDGAVW